MSLGTFGAVLKFAMELETMGVAYYETAITTAQNQELKSLIETLIAQGQKRTQTLMRVRRENTTEMILEPITGLDSQNYRLQTECPPGCSNDQLIQLACTLEEQIRQFYLDAGEKLGFLSEVADIFERLAEENANNKKHLQTVID
jgi:rubrerythrin